MPPPGESPQTRRVGRRLRRRPRAARERAKASHLPKVWASHHGDYVQPTVSRNCIYRCGWVGFTTLLRNMTLL